MSARKTANGAEHGDSAAEEPAGAEEEERLGYALAHPAGADLVAVAHLREQVRRLDEQYDRSPAAALIAETGQCLGQIGFLRAHARRADVRRDLCAAEAEAATLMGQLVWDASQRRDQATALAYYDQAVTAARSRGDRAAEGLALLRMSMVALYGHKDARAGLAACQHTAECSGHREQRHRRPGRAARRRGARHARRTAELRAGPGRCRPAVRADQPG